MKLLLIEEDTLEDTIQETTPSQSSFLKDNVNRQSDSEISRYEFADELKRLIVTSITLKGDTNHFGRLPLDASDATTIVKHFVVGNSGSLMTAITSNQRGEAALIGKSINISRFFEVLESIVENIHDLKINEQEKKLNAVQYINFLDSCRSLKSFLEMNSCEAS